MLALTLNEKEVATLNGALESYLSDLATERAGTDNREWNEELREEETILADIQKRLGGLKS